MGLLIIPENYSQFSLIEVSMPLCNHFTMSKLKEFAVGDKWDQMPGISC